MGTIFHIGEIVPEVATRVKRLALIKRILRFRFTMSDAAAVASTLEGCTPPLGNCRCGGCITCKRALQRGIVLVGQAAFAHTPSCFRYQLTVIPEHARAEVTALSGVTLDDLTRDLRSTLESVDPRIRYLGGWDISLNDECQRGRGKYWQPHVHLVVETRRKAYLLKVLAETYASTQIHRPVLFEPFDNSTLGLSYLFKSGYFAKKTFFRSSINRSWKSRITKLTAKEEAQLYIWLASIGLSGRLISNVDLEGNTP